jgi:hypothetical protein
LESAIGTANIAHEIQTGELPAQQELDTWASTQRNAVNTSSLRPTAFEEEIRAQQENLNLQELGAQSVSKRVLDPNSTDNNQVNGRPINQTLGGLFLEENKLMQAMVGDNFLHTQTNQIGLSLMRMEDSASAWFQTLNDETTRLYTKFFSSGNISHTTVSIPLSWANFFIAQLINPDSFDWIKSLLMIGIACSLENPNFETI